jgi:predicted DNA-binding protein
MKPRHHLYLDDELTAQLDALASKPGATKSAIVADALRHYLTRRGAHSIDEVLRIRLDRQARQLERVERDLQVLLESLALYVRYQLTVTAPLPEPDRAAHAVGKERFQKFIDQVGRQMAAPTRTLSAGQEDAA